MNRLRHAARGSVLVRTLAAAARIVTSHRPLFRYPLKRSSVVMARLVSPIAHSSAASAAVIADGSLFLRAFDRLFGATAEGWRVSKTHGRVERLFIGETPRGEEAVRLANSDPSVQAGRLRVDVLTWYGPVGLTYKGAPPG